MGTHLAYFLVIPIAMIGCSSTIDSKQKHQATLYNKEVLLTPFLNATHNENASVAITELLDSQLTQLGVIVKRVEEPKNTQQFLAISHKTEDEYRLHAQNNKTPYLIIGTVIEYGYKVDLDADPTVAATARIVHTETGKTVWDGTANNIGIGFSSLGAVSQEMIHDLVHRMPIR